MLDLRVGMEIVLKIAQKFDQNSTRNMVYTLFTKEEFQKVKKDLYTFLISTLVDSIDLPEVSV